MRTHLDHLETSGTAWFMLASHGPVFNTQNLNSKPDWIGLDWIYLRTLLLLEHLAVLIKGIDNLKVDVALNLIFCIVMGRV